MTEKGIRDYFEQTMAADATITPKQRAILQASLDLFAEQGFDHTSTSDIATRAGVAEGTVYRRYKTKNAIREAVVAPIIDNIVPSMAADFSEAELHQNFATLADFFQAIFSDRLAFVTDNAKELKVVFEMIFFNADSRSALMQRVGPMVVDQIGSVFTDLKERQLIVDWPNDLIIQTMLSMLVGYFARLVMGFPDTDITRETDFIVMALTKTFAPAAD